MSSRPHWVQMVLATVVVMVLPAVIVGALGVLGVIGSVGIGVVLSAVLALAATSLGSAYWRRHARGDVLFSDLLLWGWLRRGRMERRLGRADELLDRAGTADAAQKAEILRDLGVALDAQDPYLDGHSRRVARYAAMTARRLNLPREQADRVRTAAMIHDIGKLRIPKAIVSKPGRLTDDEFELMKQHAAEGGRMVECLGDAALAAAVRSHHERWDGSGYPDGLSAERIPLEARIISVVDTFDAIASQRVYRDAKPHAKVLRIIDEEAGRQFDPEAARAFISCYSDRRGAAMWAAIVSVPRQLAERLSIRPGEIAGLMGAAVTASVVVVAGAIAAQALPVSSEPPTGARAVSRQAAVTSKTPSARTASPGPSTPPVAGTVTPRAAAADTPPGEGTRAVQAQGTGTQQSRGDIAGAQATLTSSPGRPSEPPPALPAAAIATPVLELPTLAPEVPLLATPAPELPTLAPEAPLLPTPTSEPTAEPTRAPPPTPTPEPILPEPSSEPVPPLLVTTLPVFPASTPTPPTHGKDDCKNGGWMELGSLNQGLCIADAERDREP